MARAHTTKVMYAVESKLDMITRQGHALALTSCCALEQRVWTIWIASSRRFRTPAPALAIQRYTPDEERARAKLGIPYSYY
ncbi:hypothetical protein BLAT2472_130043 [Burkholderia latens]